MRSTSVQVCFIGAMVLDHEPSMNKFIDPSVRNLSAGKYLRVAVIE